MGSLLISPVDQSSLWGVIVDPSDPSARPPSECDFRRYLPCATGQIGTPPSVGRKRGGLDEDREGKTGYPGKGCFVPSPVTNCRRWRAARTGCAGSLSVEQSKLNKPKGGVSPLEMNR